MPKDYLRSFTLADIELKGWMKFQKHKCKAKNREMKLSFCTGSGIGIAVEASCVCGKTKDITDYSMW